MLTLALGIGASAAFFSVLNGLVLKPLPFPDGERLVLIWETMPAGGDTTVNPANFLAWRAGAESFSGIAAVNFSRPTITAPGQAERLLGSVVSEGFFRVLGVAPVLGSGFQSEHYTPGGQQVVLLSHGTWRGRFGGDPEVVGRTCELDGETYTVVGVLPEGYRHADPAYQAGTELFLPYVPSFRERDRSRTSRYLRVVGRLRGGVGPEQAQAEMTALAGRLAAAYPEMNEGWDARVVPLAEELYGEARKHLPMLLGAAGFVLLLVCVNVAGLVVGRGFRRQRELAVRAALGSGRARLVRLLFVETLCLALFGGLLGIAGVAAAGGVLRHLHDRFLAPFADPGLDLRGIGFTLLLVLAVALVCGLLPAARAALPDLRRVLAGDFGGERGTARTRTALLVTEVAATVVLLVASVLLIRSFWVLVHVPPGFQSEGILTFRATIPRSYDSDDKRLAVWEAITGRLEALPGVEAASLVSDLPFTRINQQNPIQAVGAPEPLPKVEYRGVGPKYFDVLGIPLVAGRPPNEADRVGTPGVAVVNRALADRLWPGRNPVGESALVGYQLKPPPAEVIGVVADVLDDGYESEAEPRCYLASLQGPWFWSSLVLKTSVEPESLVPAVRREVAAVDSRIPLDEMRTMASLVAETVAGRRLGTSVLTAFAALALLLSGVGVYGVVAYSVATRRREIGIRCALGAAPYEVLRKVLGESVRTAAIGLAIGLLLAAGVARALAHVLFGVTPADAMTYVTVGVLVVGVAVLAGLPSAQRAARVDPAEVLRHE